VVQTAGIVRAALIAGTAPRAPIAQAASETLQANGPTLEAVDRAARLPLTSVRPRFAVLRSVPVWSLVTPVMSLRTLDAVSRGDTDAAVASLLSALRFLRGASADTQSFAATQQANVVRGVVADLTVMLHRLQVPPASLDEIDRALADLFRQSDLQRLISGQAQFRYANISVYNATGLFGEVIRPARYRVAAGIARSAVEALDVANRPWPDRVRGMQRLRPWTVWFAPKPLRMIGGEANRIVLQGLAEDFATGVAAVNVARTAIAIERYRQDHNTLPDALSQVAMPSDTSLDPFTGKPLQFHRLDTGYELYSVGHDEKDNGGDIGPDEKTVMPGSVGRDIGIAMPLPAVNSSPRR
jgi:hypothetical protein